MRTCQQRLEAKLGCTRKAGLLWLDRLFSLLVLSRRRSKTPFLSDSKQELAVEFLRLCLEVLHAQTLFTELKSFWDNGYLESFNG
jgi:hypothetical protein